MSKRQKVHERRLGELENAFQQLLLACLRECSEGRYGLFGQNDNLDPEGKHCGWPEAKGLKRLAHEINSIRMEFGETNRICEQFLRLCSLRGSSVPGEPRLAAEFLTELGQRR
jgi:hypothetical protein